MFIFLYFFDRISVFNLLKEWVYSGVITSLKVQPKNAQEIWERCGNALELAGVACDYKIAELEVFCLWWWMFYFVSFTLVTGK